VKTLLLVAGQSKRFWPLAEKTLFPICGTNLLEITLGQLEKAGLTDVTIVGGPHNLDQLSARYPSISTVEQEDLSLGMRGALLSALPSCGEEPVIIVCVNDVIEPHGYKDLLKTAQQPDTAGALLAQRVERYFPGGYLKLDGTRIVAIEEKPGAGNEPSDLVNIVAHIHNHPHLLLEILKATSGKADDAYERALGSLFADHPYRAVPYLGVWQAVKYPWHVLQLLSFLLKGVSEQRIHPSADVHPSAVIDGPVVLEEGVRVFPHATVRGPCVIGAQSIIANNTLVRDSSIGEQCVVGFGSEVKSSVIAHHVWTHMSYVGDSVVGYNVSFGGGSITGNLRLDEEEISSTVQNDEIPTGLRKFGTVIGNHCRLGIHTSINPGCKIGSGTFINSHTLISQDIPDGSFVTVKGGETQIRENRIAPPPPEERATFREESIR